MARKVAAREFCDGFLARQHGPVRTSFREECVGELFASPCSAANHAIEFGMHHEVREPLNPVGGNARFPQTPFSS